MGEDFVSFETRGRKDPFNKFLESSHLNEPMDAPSIGRRHFRILVFIHFYFVTEIYQRKLVQKWVFDGKAGEKQEVGGAVGCNSSRRGRERERVGKGRDREGRSGVGAAISTENSQSAANLP